MHRAVAQAVEYAKTLSHDVRAVYVNVDPLTTERLDLPSSTKVVLITRVEPLSAAFDGGIGRGAILLEINRQRVESVADYGRIARSVSPGDILTLYLYSPELGQRQFKTIRVDDR